MPSLSHSLPAYLFREKKGVQLGCQPFYMQPFCLSCLLMVFFTLYKMPEWSVGEKTCKQELYSVTDCRIPSWEADNIYAASVKWNGMSLQVDWWLKIGNGINCQHTPRYAFHLLHLALSGILSNTVCGITVPETFSIGICTNVTLQFGFNHFSQFQRYHGGRAHMAGLLPWMDTGSLGKAGQEGKEGEPPRMWECSRNAWSSA